MDDHQPDHYELLGVSPDAEREEIREAYRTRRQELEADGTEEARGELGAVVRAWNVLADPAQRRRYDQQRASGGEAPGASPAGEGEERAGDEEPERPRGFLERLANPQGGGDRSRPTPAAPEPTIEIPAGLTLADTRPRVLAMLIDLTVLLVLFFGVQIAAQGIIVSQYPDEVDRLDRLTDQIEDVEDLDDVADGCADDTTACAEDAVGGADDAQAEAAAYTELAELARDDGEDAVEQQLDAVSGDDDAAEAERARLESCLDDFDRCPADADARAVFADELAGGYDMLAEAASAGDEEAIEARADAAEDLREDLEEEAEDVQGELFGPQAAALGLSYLLGLLYLVPPSALTGQTLGKRLRGVRVVRVDGSPPGWSASVVRYGLPVAFTAATFFVVGQLGFVLALVGVLLWLRNPNRQGLHDRAAKTLVVEA